jgi:hypothetical protein
MDPKKTFNTRSEFEHLLQGACKPQHFRNISAFVHAYWRFFVVGLPFIGNVSNTASENEYADVLFVCFDFENGQQIKSHAASGSFGNRKILA